jgi:hypothetical protein
MSPTYVEKTSDFFPRSRERLERVNLTIWGVVSDVPFFNTPFRESESEGVSDRHDMSFMLDSNFHSLPLLPYAEPELELDPGSL